MAIAHGRLRHLRYKGLGIAEQEMHDGANPTKFLQHEIGFKPIFLASALHQGATRRRFTAHEERNADNAFVADDRNLCRGAFLTQGDDAIEEVGKYI